MFLKVDPGSPVPMYRQLMDQIRFAVASGRMRPEEKLPGVREVAEELRVNLQTVVKAYNELVREGTLEMRRGLGTYVSERPRPLRSARAREAIEGQIRQLCRDAFAQGWPVEEVHKLIQKIWHEVRPGPDPGPLGGRPVGPGVAQVGRRAAAPRRDVHPLSAARTESPTFSSSPWA
jgi:GntR family transcriptional regulator